MDLEDVQQRLTRAMACVAAGQIAIALGFSPYGAVMPELRQALGELQELMRLVTAASEQQARPVEPTDPPR